MSSGTSSGFDSVRDTSPTPILLTPSMTASVPLSPRSSSSSCSLDAVRAFPKSLLRVSSPHSADTRTASVPWTSGSSSPVCGIKARAMRPATATSDKTMPSIIRPTGFLARTATCSAMCSGSGSVSGTGSGSGAGSGCAGISQPS